jgi:hypothetical protein
MITNNAHCEINLNSFMSLYLIYVFVNFPTNIGMALVSECSFQSDTFASTESFRY